MKTTNWQTKALTLFIAAAALWLATACTTYYPINYPVNGIRVISSEPCEIDVPLVPSQEYVKLAEQLKQLGDQVDYMESREIKINARDAWYARLKPEFNRILEVVRTYADLLRKYPNFELTIVEEMRTWDGAWTDKLVVVVYVSHLFDPRTIPPEERIPSCIAGVPVHFMVQPTATPGY